MARDRGGEPDLGGRVADGASRTDPRREELDCAHRALLEGLWLRVEVSISSGDRSFVLLLTPIRGRSLICPPKHPLRQLHPFPSPLTLSASLYLSRSTLSQWYCCLVVLRLHYTTPAGEANHCRPKLPARAAHAYLHVLLTPSQRFKTPTPTSRRSDYVTNMDLSAQDLSTLPPCPGDTGWPPVPRKEEWVPSAATSAPIPRAVRYSTRVAPPPCPCPCRSTAPAAGGPHTHITARVLGPGVHPGPCLRHGF